MPDGPTFKEKPRSMEADIGSLVTLNCEVDGNPTPDVVWIQHPIDRVSILNFWEKEARSGVFQLKDLILKKFYFKIFILFFSIFPPSLLRLSAPVPI